jgi:hypothetical protein
MRAILLSVLCVFGNFVARGNQDVLVVQNFGNVKVQMESSPYSEEIQKVWTIGRLAEQLCKQLNYSKPVYVDLYYSLNNESQTHYISFDSGIVNEYVHLKRGRLTIRKVGTQFDARTILKVLEFAITHTDEIKLTQQEICIKDFYARPYFTDSRTIEGDHTYCINTCINTYDTAKIRTVQLQKESALLQQIFSTRVYRHIDLKAQKGLSYYCQNNKYYVFDQSHKTKDSALLTLNNLYYFKKVSSNKAVLVGANDSVYFISSDRDPYFSTTSITNISNSFLTPTISRSKHGKVDIAFAYFDGPQLAHQKLTYDYKTGELTKIERDQKGKWHSR